MSHPIVIYAPLNRILCFIASIAPDAKMSGSNYNLFYITEDNIVMYLQNYSPTLHQVTYTKSINVPHPDVFLVVVNDNVRSHDFIRLRTLLFKYIQQVQFVFISDNKDTFDYVQALYAIQTGGWQQTDSKVMPPSSAPKRSHFPTFRRSHADPSAVTSRSSVPKHSRFSKYTRRSQANPSAVTSRSSVPKQSRLSIFRRSQAKSSAVDPVTVHVPVTTVDGDTMTSQGTTRKLLGMKSQGTAKKSKPVLSEPARSEHDVPPTTVPTMIVLPCSHYIGHNVGPCDGTLSIPKKLTCHKLKHEKGFCGDIDVDWTYYQSFYVNMRSSRMALRKRCRTTDMLTEATHIYNDRMKRIKIHQQLIDILSFKK